MKEKRWNKKSETYKLKKNRTVADVYSKINGWYKTSIESFATQFLLHKWKIYDAKLTLDDLWNQWIPIDNHHFIHLNYQIVHWPFLVIVFGLLLLCSLTSLSTKKNTFDFLFNLYQFAISQTSHKNIEKVIVGTLKEICRVKLDISTKMRELVPR